MWTLALLLCLIAWALAQSPSTRRTCPSTPTVRAFSIAPSFTDCREYAGAAFCQQASSSFWILCPDDLLVAAPTPEPIAPAPGTDPLAPTPVPVPVPTPAPPPAPVAELLAPMPEPLSLAPLSESPATSSSSSVPTAEGPAGAGPVVEVLTGNPTALVRAGQPIPIRARVTSSGGAAISAVALTYRTNFDAEVNVLMQAVGGGVYEATIPGSAVASAGMIRWAVRAQEAGGPVTREPVVPPADNPEGPLYFGAMVEGWVVPPEADPSTPLLYVSVQNPERSETVIGTRASIFYEGQFLDNVFMRRRGQTTLAWPKPKLKFNFKGPMLTIVPGGPKYDGLKLNSLYIEVSERSTVRENVAATIMQEVGVPAYIVFHILALRNGKFYGLFNIDEEIDDVFLQRLGLPDGDAGGLLFESYSGSLSNLRWDVRAQDMPAFYEIKNGKDADAAANYELLHNFTTGLGGGGPVPRCPYIFDYVDLPEVVNEMAVQTVLFNQDRLTKNFDTYYNPVTDRFSRIPWDLEQSLGISSGLGGIADPNYCSLACTRFNTPLYGDSEYPQDVQLDFNPFTIPAPPSEAPAAAAGGDRRRSRSLLADLGRKLQQPQTAADAPSATAAAPASAATNAAGGVPPAQPGPRVLPPGSGMTELPPASDIIRDLTGPSPAEANRDRTGEATDRGPAGTYNHLYDAVLDCAASRAMYMRRTRTLLEYLRGPEDGSGTDRVADKVKELYAPVAAIARVDEALWNETPSQRGVTQLLTEQLPRRKVQLYSVYGPGGPIPLLPGSQTAAPSVKVGSSDLTAADPGQRFVEIRNEEPAEAIDVSGWKVTVGAAAATLPPGAVIPPAASLYLVGSVPKFRARTTAPHGGQGLLYIDAGPGVQLASGAITLQNVGGATVGSGAAAAPGGSTSPTATSAAAV